MKPLLVGTAIVLGLSVALASLHSRQAVGGALAGTLLAVVPAVGVLRATRLGLLNPAHAPMLLTAGRMLLFLVVGGLIAWKLERDLRKVFLLALIGPYLAMMIVDSWVVIRETKNPPAAGGIGDQGTGIRE